MKTGKKLTGGLYHAPRKKKHYEKKGQVRLVKLGAVKKKLMRTRGGRQKIVLLNADIANIFNPKTKKSRVSKITNVIKTPSNRFLARQNVLQKSSIIETELGKARITNRPSQEGNVQAVLILE